MKTLASLKRHAKERENQMVVIANAADKEMLLAVKAAIDTALCSFKLVGDETKINSLAKEINLDLSSENIVLQHEMCTSEIAHAAVGAVHNNEAQILMKGDLPTKEILKAVLHKENGLRSGKILSHVALFEIPGQDRLIFLTDAAMNIAPNLQEKADIINNAVQIAKGIGTACPKVAVITPVEVVNQSMPSTVDAAALTQMQKRGQIQGCLIDGPLAFDNAVSVEAAQQKGIVSNVAGVADILMVPSLEVGNALYKSFIYFAHAKVAAIICGAKAPIVLTSRADSAESKLHSLSLALLTSKYFGRN